MRPPSRATTYRAFLFCVSSWRNAFAGHGTGNDARSTSCTPSMSSRVISSMTIGNVATILLKLSGALGETERALVRRWRREWLLERSADRGLSHVQGLDLADLHLRACFELAPAELGKVARPTHPRRGRGEERLRAEQVAERRLDFGVDLADEERVRADLPADLVERRHEEG